MASAPTTAPIPIDEVGRRIRSPAVQPSRAKTGIMGDIGKADTADMWQVQES